ncbi:MAG: glycosyltransferase [Gammaproteobacteria bacterium]|nr:glycosyltransferase [Gammaproteobacteria bacterium]
MKVLLLQDQVHLPSLGGGNKSTRLLLEDLASRGHECLAICPALTSRAGPTSYAELVIEMSKRGVDIRSNSETCFFYSHNDVDVEALSERSPTMLKKHVHDTIRRFRPDLILVSDDKRRILLDCAIQYAPSQVIQIVQTVIHLPFGPLSHHTSARQTKLMGRARRIFVISDFVRHYIKTYSKLESTVVSLPVYGPGPFNNLGRFSHGYLTLINPCVEKGLDIFLQLASRLPDSKFAVVPSWGTDDNVIRSLVSRPNIFIIPPADDLNEVWEQTSILTVPSIWFETFGYVVVEAMLRGIPVVASDIGGLPEAKLGVDYLVPVSPAVRRKGKFYNPGQDVEPWLRVLGELLSNKSAYDHCSSRSQEAASQFLRRSRLDSFSSMLESLGVTRR